MQFIKPPPIALVCGVAAVACVVAASMYVRSDAVVTASDKQVQNTHANEVRTQLAGRMPAAGAGGVAAEAPGFYVQISGRTTFGKTEADVQRFITSELYENLRQLARRPGLGFHLPAEDPNLDPSERNLRSPVISQFASVTRASLPQGDAEQDQHRDPVTGEDMSTDWVFDFSFKIKLGEMPPGGGR